MLRLRQNQLRVKNVRTNKLLLLDELYVGERVSGELDGLIEAGLVAVAHVHDLDHLGLQTLCGVQGKSDWCEFR